MAEDAQFRLPKTVEPGWTEEQAAAGHAGLLAIFEAIDEPVYVADPTTYELLFVNRATIPRIRSLGRRRRTWGAQPAFPMACSGRREVEGLAVGHRGGPRGSPHRR